ncbi:O-glucosyltransferase rumi homolog [Abrus precatorius]|uniref:O-glucosyltransferase rumi homolog n=1 Tax=Abrus precatorius TaxID=3816 RepID=A0A8B8M0F8_ABRPR|nr:O-glucosyltransferase rumi homolog [Abrus precatorius]
MQKFISQTFKKLLAGPSLFKKGPVAAYTSLLFLLILLTAAFVSSFWSTLPTANTAASTIANKILGGTDSAKIKRFEQATLNCSIENNGTCPSNYYPTTRFEMEEEGGVCPEYFRWIHEDLRAWKEKGISREMVEIAKKTAHFRLVVKKGRAYVEKYKKSIQTRDEFTIWGILQLLRRYPGRVADLELMFDCDDLPVIHARDHHGPNITAPPPLFRYCGDRWTEDIVFPDWSFWGWAEINIRPWEHLLKEIEEGNKRIEWDNREPYAYWKGNPFVAETRQDLLKCNLSSEQDWNARLFVQDWILESQQGFNQSNLANQCTYRYKIYIEGYAWSVSEKYILACDSVTLLVKPRFYDFFIRSLQPTQHYWPIRDNNKCKSIKHAVDWGNNHKQEAQKIGKAASKFIQEELKMDYVYDYMFHLLNEYAKLLKFEPIVPEGAVELCAEAMACPRSGFENKFMNESMVTEPSTKAPCSLPPPLDPTSLRIFNGNKLNLIRRVETMEDNYWKNATEQLHTQT